MFRSRFGAPTGAHSQEWGRCLTVGEISDRIHSERLHAAAQQTRARQAAIAAAFDAPTLTLPIVVAEVIDAEIVEDPTPTLPLTRAELAALAEAEQWRTEDSAAPVGELTDWERDLLALPEVDGGRPLHDLDFVNRYAMGGVR